MGITPAEKSFLTKLDSIQWGGSNEVKDHNCLGYFINLTYLGRMYYPSSSESTKNSKLEM